MFESCLNWGYGGYGGEYPMNSQWCVKKHSMPSTSMIWKLVKAQASVWDKIGHQH